MDERTLDTIKALRWIAALYPHVTLAEENILAYAGELRDIDTIDLLSGARALVRAQGNHFFPSVGDLRTAAEKASGLARPSGSEAWGLVKKEMLRVGSRRKPELDPVTLAAIEATGGWEAFGQSDVDDEPSWRAQFIRAYDRVAERADAVSARRGVVLEIASGAGPLSKLLQPSRALLLAASNSPTESANTNGA